MDNLQREVYTMRADMVNNERLYVWSQEMEGAITPVWDKLDDRMKKR